MSRNAWCNVNNNPNREGEAIGQVWYLFGEPAMGAEPITELGRVTYSSDEERADHPFRLEFVDSANLPIGLWGFTPVDFDSHDDAVIRAAQELAAVSITLCWGNGNPVEYEA